MDGMLRYSRHIVLEDFGIEGQQKLKEAKVLVAGAGGLGSPALGYLAAAGVGTIGVADYDTVVESNFNRQWMMHHTRDIGKLKTDSAAEKIALINPDVTARKHGRLSGGNIEDIVKDYDVVIDASDNFATRFLISDCCYFLKKPVIEAGAAGYESLLLTIIPDKTPCYRCLYPLPPPPEAVPKPEEAGILGMVAGITGTLQALEAVKVILGIGSTVSGRVLTFDGKNTTFRSVPWKKRDDCPLCGKKPSITVLT
jgi:molybdopterin-synthase adenylyltransferase